MGKRRKPSTSVAKKQHQSNSDLVLKLNQYYVSRDYTSVVNIWKDSSLESPDFECASIAAASYYFLEDYINCNSILQDHSVSVFENPDVAALFGASLRLEGRFNDSESVFKQALSLHPDHPSLSNNYSNLLIQLDRLSEAHDILRNICDSAPTYKDAHNNLHRVLALIEQKHSSSVSSTSSTPKQDTVISDSPPEFKYSIESLFNPSHDAFSLQELQLNSLSNTDKKAVKTLLAETTSSDPALLHQCIRFSRLTVESQPKLTLDDCNAVLDRFGLMPEIYELAAEAFLYLKQFSDAEAALSSAYHLGSRSSSVLSNLATLCAMRGDQTLGLHWLKKHEEFFPSPDLNDRLRKQIMSSPSKPFYHDHTSQAPGNILSS